MTLNAGGKVYCNFEKTVQRERMTAHHEGEEELVEREIV
jgi:hypothetical protein